MNEAQFVKTEHELIELGYRYERAQIQRSIAIRQTFSNLLQQYPIYRDQFIYWFEQGRKESRITK
jgi:hypothetical protein